MRALLGFLVAPLAPAFLMYLYGLYFDSSEQVKFWPLMFGAFAYLAAFVFGLPAYLLFRRKNIHELKIYLPAGALIGVAGFLLFIFISTPSGLSITSEHTQGLLRNSIDLGVSSIAYAIFSSFLFWLIAVKDKK